jgi:hypothetical protein
VNILTENILAFAGFSESIIFHIEFAGRKWELLVLSLHSPPVIIYLYIIIFVRLDEWKNVENLDGQLSEMILHVAHLANEDKNHF